MDSTVSGSSVAKRLASCNKATRERALRLLKSWLSSHSTSSSSTVSDDDLLKIWKGLFYCIWHADKLPVQLDLINRLSSLVSGGDLSLSIRYFEAFLSTIRREWNGIDQLRLDKFYLLIRRFLHQFFQLLSQSSWDLDLSARMIQVLSGKSLLVVDNYSARGVNYHISEIFLDEIKEFLPAPPSTLDVLLKPFFSVMEKSSDKVLVNKIKSNVFDRLLENGVKYLNFARAGGDADPSDDEVEKFGKITLSLGLSDKLFDSASSSDTVQGNRKVLFSLHEGFQKLQKDLEKSGVRIPFPQENGDSLKATTEPLILECNEKDEVDLENCYGEINEKPSRKRKKSKKTLSGDGKKSKTKKSELSDSLAVTENGTSTVNSESGHPSNVENLDGDIVEKRAKKLSAGGRKKKSVAKNKEGSDSVSEILISSLTKDSDIVREEETLNGGIMENGNLITFNEKLVSNLQMQFEKVAAEAGMPSVKSCTTPVTSIPMKRKRMKNSNKKLSTSPSGAVSGSTTGKSGGTSVKKVRFSMKSNLVWKPHSPLPPQSLRLPPSATPRGSALKKGIPPGPIRETPSTTKKKKLKAVKKAWKASKSVSPAVKRLRKLQSVSV